MTSDDLTIRPDVTAKRILFDGTEGRPRAIGVEVVSGDEVFVVEAGEVILSAGAIASPQLLMLSGVGPKQHLEEYGISTLVDSQGVGQNLRDHPLIYINWATKPEVDLDPFGPRMQLTLRYTADGSKLENDMIVYMQAVAGKDPYRGGKRTEPTGMAMGICINLALSKGEIRLNSSDHRLQPYLDYNYFEEEEESEGGCES